MSSIGIAVIGASGRMGQEVCRLCEGNNQIELVAGVSRKPNPQFPLNHLDIADLEAKGVDVIIDFSLPSLTKDVARWCGSNKIRLVSGVTGLTSDQMATLEEAAKNVAVFWAPNMSVGIAVMAEMLESLQHLQDFDFQVEEVHHRMKKDKPSGTGIFLQTKLQETLDSKQKALLAEPVSIRGGGVFGIHRVLALGAEETITIEHTALNRAVFARGALQAATWLSAQPPGFYKMRDLLRG